MLQVTREQFEQQSLVLLVGPEGGYEWSSDRSRADVVKMLRNVADEIEDEQ